MHTHMYVFAQCRQHNSICCLFFIIYTKLHICITIHMFENPRTYIIAVIVLFTSEIIFDDNKVITQQILNHAH